MIEWSSDNLACLHLWTTLYELKQLKSTFKAACDVQMNSLLFYNPLISNEELRISALELADELDQILLKTWGGSYQEGVNRDKVVNDMVTVLLDKTKKVLDLADCINNEYKFPN